MAGVSIKVELDDKGVAPGTQRIENQLKQMEGNLQQVGQRGNVVFTEMARQQDQVAASAENMGRMGVQAMGNITGASQSAIGAANGATAALGATIPVLGLIAVAVIQNRDKIVAAAEAWGGYTERVKEAYTEVLKVNEKALTTFGSQGLGYQLLAQTNAQITALENERNAYKELRDSAINFGIAGAGVAAMAQSKMTEATNKLQDAEARRITQLGQLNKLAEDSNRKQIQYLEDEEKRVQKLSEKEIAAAKKAATEREQAFKHLMTLGEQWEAKGVDQGEKVDHSFVMAYQHAIEEARKSGASQEQVQAVLAQVIAGYGREREEANEREADTAIKAAQRSAKERQAAEKSVTDAAQREGEMRERLYAQAEMANEQAAALLAPPWERGLRSIEAEHTRAMERIRRESEKLPEGDASVLAARNAEWARYDAALTAEHRRMTEDIARDLESAFDDLTSGKLGERILANFKKLMFMLIAQSLEASGIMKSGIGSIFRGAISGDWSSVLQGNGASVGGGSIFGGAANAGGMATTPGFNGSMPGAGAPIGAGGIFAGIPGLGRLLGGGGSSAPFIAGNGGAIPDTRAPFDIFGQATGAGSAALRSKVNLNQLAGLGGALISTGLGGNAGALGSLISSLAMSDKLKGTMLGNVLGYAGIGISGFGIGSNTGKVGGLLGGGASGALTGFMIGGPIGALVGGIVGAIGGLFGGIGGGAKRTKQANAIAGSFETQINQILTSFKSFQTDYASAKSAMQQLEQSAQQQLDGLKGEGDKAFGRRVMPAFGAAMTELENIQSERTRRSGLVFAPPMFDTGGFVGGNRISGWRMSNGAVAAVIHEGEYVVNKQATAKNRGKLEAMNAGGDGEGLTVNFYTMDVMSFKKYMADNGGWEALVDVSRAKKREGKGL